MSVLAVGKGKPGQFTLPGAPETKIEITLEDLGAYAESYGELLDEFKELVDGCSERVWYVFVTAHKVMPLGAFRQTLSGRQQEWISNLIDDK